MRTGALDPGVILYLLRASRVESSAIEELRRALPRRISSRQRTSGDHSLQVKLSPIVSTSIRVS
jgi:hypothetical protein